MSSWLYSQLLDEDESRQPAFSLQSTVGWIQALRHEIEAEHGKRASTQFKSCRKLFRQTVKPAGKPPPLAAVFEPLFSSITGSMTLERISTSYEAVPWVRPTAVVTWYYAVYASVRAMLAALGQMVVENHSATMKAYAATLQPKLPHPLNMRAFRTAGETYSIILPSHPRARPYDLIRTFPGTSAAARGMLVQYLSGTSKWYVERTKAQILRENKFNDFRTKLARVERDRRLQNKIAFLHCAFRYRGKANYRDAIYLTYGSGDLATAASLVTDLARCAQFASVVAIAFVERRIGKPDTNAFINDLKKNLRGMSLATPLEVFWDQL